MKSKKVLTILLSLAIMLTFMPTMAFAAYGDPDNVTCTVTVKDSSETVTKTSIADAIGAVNDEGTITVTGEVNNSIALTVNKGFTLDMSGATVDKDVKVTAGAGACLIETKENAYLYHPEHVFTSADAVATADSVAGDYYTDADVVLYCEYGDTVEATAEGSLMDDEPIGGFWLYEADWVSETVDFPVTWKMAASETGATYALEFDTIDYVKDATELAVGDVSFFAYYTINDKRAVDDNGKPIKLEGTIKSKANTVKPNANKYGYSDYTLEFTLPNGTKVTKENDQPIVRTAYDADTTAAVTTDIVAIEFLCENEEGKNAWASAPYEYTSSSVSVDPAELAENLGNDWTPVVASNGTLTYRFVSITDKYDKAWAKEHDVTPTSTDDPAEKVFSTVKSESKSTEVNTASIDYKKCGCGYAVYPYKEVRETYTRGSGAIVTAKFTVAKTVVEGKHLYADRNTWSDDFPAVTNNNHYSIYRDAHCKLCDRTVRTEVPGTDHELKKDGDKVKVVEVKATCQHKGYKYNICEKNDNGWAGGEYVLKDADGKYVDTIKFADFSAAGGTNGQHPVLVEGSVTDRTDHVWVVESETIEWWGADSDFIKDDDVICLLEKKCDNGEEQCTATQWYMYHKNSFAEEAPEWGFTPEDLVEGTTDTVLDAWGTLHVFGAINVDETKGADCTKKNSFTFTVKDVKKAGGAAITTTAESEVYAGPHTYKNSVTFSADGSRATVVQQCTKGDDCLGRPDADGNLPTHTMPADVSSVNNADGSITYTATLEGYELTNNTKTVFDLTKATVIVNGGEEIDINTFDIDDLADIVEVRINGVAIAKKYYVTSIADGRFVPGNNVVIVRANSDYENVYGVATGIAKCVQPGQLAIATVSFDGVLETESIFDPVITYDGKAHTVEVTAKVDETGAATDATIKYAVVKAFIDEDGYGYCDAKGHAIDWDGSSYKYDLDKVEFTDAGRYVVFAELAKEGYTTKKQVAGVFRIDPIDTDGAVIYTLTQVMTYGDTGFVATTGDPELDKTIGLTTLDASKLGVGEYYLPMLVEFDHNYDVDVATQEVKIEKRNAKVVLKSVTKTYDGKEIDPSTLYTIDGAVNNDNLNVIVNTEGDKKVAVEPGTYKLVATANNANYNIEIVPATLQINKIAQSVDSVSPLNKSFKASKKTKKLAKKKTFNLSATTSGDSNAKVTFAKTSGNKKIKVSSNGKVTVKKKLKKGTYKVKVTVTKAATAHYAAATKDVTVTIKIK